MGGVQVLTEDVIVPNLVSSDYGQNYDNDLYSLFCSAQGTSKGLNLRSVPQNLSMQSQSFAMDNYAFKCAALPPPKSRAKKSKQKEGNNTRECSDLMAEFSNQCNELMSRGSDLSELSYKSENLCLDSSSFTKGNESSNDSFFGKIANGISNLFSGSSKNSTPQVISEAAPRRQNSPDNLSCDEDGMDLEEMSYKPPVVVKQKAKQNKILNPKDIFSYRDIDGNWEYSNDLLRLFGRDDSQLEQLNNILGGGKDKNVLITLIALAYIQINQSQFGAENKIMISKSKTWLKQILMAQDMDTVNNHITSAKSIIQTK